MKTLQLGGQEMVALVDDDVYPHVCGQLWHAIKGHNVWYAHERKTLKTLHRTVMDYFGVAAALIDHIDHNGLNCQRANLRPATAAQNGWNSRRALGASGHPGVSRNRNSWAVRFEHKGETLYFGTHRDLEVAKQIANREMWRLRGEFLPINHPARQAAIAGCIG